MVRGARVHQLTGRLAYAAGRYVEAAAAFGKAVEAEPESAGARVNLGTALAKQSRYKDAIGQFLEAVRLAPDNVSAHFNLGSLYSHLGENEKAVSHLSEVVAQQLDDPQAHLGLARALQRTGEIGKAFEHYKDAVRLAPQEAAGWLEMSSLLYLAGQYEEALQVMEEARIRVPHETSVAHGLARFLASSPDPALRDGPRALELALVVFRSHRNYEFARTVAMAYAESDQCVEAAEWQEQGIALAADSGVNDQSLARLKENLSYYQEGPPCKVPAEAGK